MTNIPRPVRFPADLPVVTKAEIAAEQVAFAKYRAEEDAKKFKVVTEYGSTRFATVAEARRFADFLDEDPRCRAIEIIEL